MATEDPIRRAAKEVAIAQGQSVIGEGEIEAIIREHVGEPERWKQIALYLADCHAATAEYEGTLSRTSKRSRERFGAICDEAARLLSGGHPKRIKNEGDVYGRCLKMARWHVQNQPEEAS